MIRHEERVMCRDEGIEATGQRLRARHLIGNERHLTHLQDNLGEYARGKPLPRYRERGRHGRMRVHDRRDIIAERVHTEMYCQLTRGASLSAKVSTIAADFYEIVGTHIDFGYP